MKKEPSSPQVFKIMINSVIVHNTVFDKDRRVEAKGSEGNRIKDCRNYILQRQ